MVERLDLAYDRIEALEAQIDNAAVQDDLKSKFAGVGKKIAQLEGKISAHEKRIAALEKAAKTIKAKYKKVQALLESGN